jgi:hypothetical protein
MTPWVLLQRDITQAQLRVFHEVCRIVGELPDTPQVVTCHDVCKAVAERLAGAEAEAGARAGVGTGQAPALRHVRGWFFRRGIEHSWLEFVGTEVVIDAYPWACGSGPFIVSREGVLNPWRMMYIT